MAGHRTYGAIVALAALLSGAVTAFALDTPAGGYQVPLLASPEALGYGLTATALDAPWADRLNPAASAGQQRPALSAAFVGLTDFGAAGQGFGGAGSLGLSVPKPFGVLGAGLRLLWTPDSMTDLPLGTLFEARGTIAKDLFPDFYVGAGLGLALGSKGGSDWGLGLDLGFVHLLGDKGFLKDLRWGGVLAGIGKGYEPAGASGAYPPPFTPTLGARALLLRSADWKLGMGLDLSAPTFQDLGLGLQASVSYKDLVALRSAWGFSVGELAAGNGRSLFPSISLTANIPIERKADESFLAKQGLNKGELRPTLAAAPLYGDVWALGAGVTIPLGVIDRKPPRIDAKFPGQAWPPEPAQTAAAPVSPAPSAAAAPAAPAAPAPGAPLVYHISPNADGVQDLLEIPVSISDERYLVGYTLTVRKAGAAASEAPLRLIANKESRPETQGLGGLWDRLVYVKKGVPVPDKLVWNGRADDGSTLPDGEYYVLVEAVDDNGNSGRAGPFAVVVDSTPPEAKAEAAEASKIFSPDGDGNKDSLLLKVSGSPEDLWKLRILDAAGKAVRSADYSAGAPSDFAWDGKADSGEVLPDGVYSMVLSSTDRAGNAFSRRVDNVVVNTQQPPVNVAIDLSAFSPNGDGQKDRVNLAPSVPVRTGLATWKLAVLDKDKKERWSRAGSDSVSLPERLAFEGADLEGKPLPEGQYQAELSVTYVNGHSPKSYSPFFTLDLTPPSATVKADRAAFNPAGREGLNLVRFAQSGSQEERWTGEILGPGGAVARTYSFGSEPDASVEWDGADDAGKPVPDGVYSYRLKAVDRAGNAFSSAPASVALDTEEKAARLSADQRAFSPNGDGQKDVIRFLPQVQAADRLRSYELVVEAVEAAGLAAGSAVRTWKGEKALPEALAWDGKGDAKAQAADGRYLARLKATYVTGEAVEASTQAFVLDTKAPSLEVKAESLLFSPNGDGRKDSLGFSQKSLPGDDWEGRILAEGGAAGAQPVRSFAWKGQAKDFSWDGADEAGNRVKDGLYRYEVSSVDQAGNSFKAQVAGIRVDARAVQVFLTASDTGISPNGDGFRDSLSFAPIVNLRDGVEGWRLSVVDKAGKELKSFSGKGGDIPARIDWDGKDASGAVVQGEAAGLLAVDYAKGDRAEAKTASILVDVDGPKVDVRLTPEFFSPDNDGVDDELSIAISVSDAGETAEWRLEIVEAAVVEGAAPGAKPRERLFIAWGGKGQPAASIDWDGRSAKGELVEAATDYPYYFTIKDELGNVSRKTGMISVDVLVIREGDRLKIKVPSIVFRSGAADFKGLEDEKLANNDKVVKRIAQILNRFRDYRIGIEGHANSEGKITGASQARIAEEETKELIPLSTGRAELVRDLLVKYGVDAKRLSVRGLGSSAPVVDFKDADNRWKNRRVEFILIKN
ncbi:MAG TPA: FlgD immunoglobulin-like domain containing protein [Spirochaetales bacterium]|nr:FlgD immunoglobulin-like domain containing protein [Spirochaetales bacterium]